MITPRMDATATPNRMASSGENPQSLAECAVAYPADPKKTAWPNERSPTYPISRLKAHAKRAKHSAFIRNTGYTK